MNEEQKMRCDFCGNDYLERQIEESHDVPKYLFKGFPNERKNQADKFGRHWLCRGDGTNQCHEKYEEALQNFLRVRAISFAKGYFDVVIKKEGTNGEDKSI